MSAINLTTVTFGTLISAPTDLRPVDVHKLIAALQNGAFSAKIEIIRSAPTPEAAKEFKSKLPYFIPGIVEKRRCNENVKAMHGLILDYDHVAEIAGFKALVLNQIAWVRWVFRSPIDGVKLYIPFTRPVTDMQEYKRIWDFLKDHCDSRLVVSGNLPQDSSCAADNAPNLPQDSSCADHSVHTEHRTATPADNTSDPARACFVTYDPDLAENADWIPFDPDRHREEINRLVVLPSGSFALNLNDIFLSTQPHKCVTTSSKQPRKRVSTSSTQPHKCGTTSTYHRS